MHHPQHSARGERSVSPLFVNDLCAQLAPLNRYGPTPLGAAIASWLRALAGVARPTVCAAAGCNRH
jgi:hypothetical protein